MRTFIARTIPQKFIMLTIISDYNCNWLGGQVIADMINAPGYCDAGFTNISTSDEIVHGQVKQSGLFSFVRIYESGHEVPFYQPLASLEMFERVLKHVDIATGEENIVESYMTHGTPTSTFREGNATIQFKVTPANATYNTALNAPDPEPTWAADQAVVKRSKERRAMSKPKMGKRTVW
jgi:hypothetical protein